MNMFYGQNIVPNGSFETFTACPTNINSGSRMRLLKQPAGIE